MLQRNYKYRKISKSDEDKDELDEDGENVELLNRCQKLNSVDYDTLFERPIQQGESLNSIALKYRIPVSDLKRVNRLQKDTEFFALNSLKIPVKVNSCLHELLAKENDSKISVTKESPSNEIQEATADGSEQAPFGRISISQICQDQSTSKEARQFLDNMRQDLMALRDKTSSYKDSLEDATSSLTSVSFSPFEQNTFGCSGADWDLQWWRVVVIGGIALIGVPLMIYFFVFSS